MIFSIRRPVPIGTVDFVMTSLGPFMCCAIERATSATYRRSADPSGFGGVPTAMKIARAPSTALDEVRREPKAALLHVAATTIASRPGS